MSEYKIQNIELIETEMQKHQKGLEKTRFSAKKHYWTKKIKRYHVLYNPDPLLKAKEEEEEELQLLSQ